MEPLEASEKRAINKENLRKLAGVFSFIWPYKGYFIIGFIFLIFSSITLLGFPMVAGKLVDAATGKADWFFKDINSIALVLIGILAIQSFFSFGRVFLFAQVSERSMKDLRVALYDRYMHLPMSFYDARRTGELFSRITSDTSMLQDSFSITLAEFFRQVLTLVFGLVFIFYTTPQLSLFMLATFPVLIVAAMVFGKFIRKLAKQTQDELAKANSIVEETLQGINMVKSFTNELFEIGRYSQSLSRVVNVALKAATFRGAFISFIIFALLGGIVAVIWYGAKLVSTGDMSVGGLISFVLYTTFIGGSIAGLGDLYSQIQRAIGASERVLEILHAGTESSANQVQLQTQGAISFNEVSFSYPTRSDVQVLKAMSLQIAAGEKIALVGHSGAGKSTIAQLIMRFYEPQEGAILLDGENIRNLDLKAYRKLVGIVPQELVLFGGSIKENIAYGNPQASDEEIKIAAKKANALDFIEKFPEGFDTLVGDRGIKLSGGQRQRIAIARAILKDPAILILDEATSSLDAESEFLVQQALEELMKNRTTIVIAHRLATIRKVDRILVLSEGEIIESGKHEDLLKNDVGTYANLVRLQLQEA